MGLDDGIAVPRGRSNTHSQRSGRRTLRRGRPFACDAASAANDGIARGAGHVALSRPPRSTSDRAAPSTCCDHRRASIRDRNSAGKVTHLPVDNHLCGKVASARDTNERLGRPQDWLSRFAERLVRTAVEAVFAAAEVTPPTIDEDLERETRAAAHAYEHASDRT